MTKQFWKLVPALIVVSALLIQPSTDVDLQAVALANPDSMIKAAGFQTVSSYELPQNWLERFNYYRQVAGLPSVAESPTFSADLAKHVNYMLLNVPAEGLWHGETPDRPGYTAEGAQAAAESNLYWFTNGASYATPVTAIDGWMGSIKHRFGMLNPDLVTTGFGFGCGVQNCGSGLNVIGGLEWGSNPRPEGVIYPGPNQTDVNTDIILTWQFLWEPTAVLKSASLRNPSGQLISITTSSPPEGDYFNTVSVKPDASLSPGTTYTASITIQLGNQELTKTWSFTTFIIPTLPREVSLLSPAGETTSSQPAFSWNVTPDDDLSDPATWYYLWVNGPSGRVLDRWYQASGICSASTCSVTPDLALGGGTYTWWVQTWNPAGYGPWSDDLVFTIPFPDAASLVSPINDINLGDNYNPTFTWNQVTGATWYYLWVNGPSGNILHQWYTSAQNCNGTTCSIIPSTSMSAGNHTWWVQIWSPAGYGLWSSAGTFHTSTTLPGKATLVSPNTNNIPTNQPTYTWNQVNLTTYYYLWVDGPAGNMIKQWYTSAQANCNGTNCSVTPSTTLSVGYHTWWIQTWNPAGYGQWSNGMSFTTTAPGIATLVSPSGSGGSNPPVYTWNKVTGATWYYVWVDGPSGNVLKQWYETSAICGASTCSASQPNSLPNGSHKWWVQTWNSVGFGPWSSVRDFNIP